MYIEILKPEHLTTKKQIESLREMYGEENWLHSHAGSYVQDILGIKQHSENESFSQANTVLILLIFDIYKCIIILLVILLFR